QVNETFPLEAGEWGLEDYVVEVEGFECVHYHEVDAILRDGDQVEIRPLRTSDVRARTLSGRHQITADGRRLIDGVPFGRPFFRPAPDRPAIKIPPKKRKRHLGSDGEDDERMLGNGSTMLLTAGASAAEDFPSEDDEDDDDFGLDDDVDGGSESQDVEDSPRASENMGKASPKYRLRSRTSQGPPRNGTRSSPKRSIREGKVLRFDDVVPSEDGKESTSDDSDSDDGQSSSSEDTSSDDDDDTSSDSSVKSSDPPSLEPIRPIRVRPPRPAKVPLPSPPRAAPATSKTPPSQRQAPPGEGLTATKTRNQRRRDSRKLKRLKAMGALPPTADKDALLEYLRQSQSIPGEPSVPEPTIEHAEGHVQSALSKGEDLTAKKKDLLVAIQSGGSDVDSYGLPPSDAALKRPANGLSEIEAPAADIVVVDSPESEPQPKRARTKLDLASSRRMLFGSLGLRTPKTKEDEEEMRRRLTKQVTPRMVPAAISSGPEDHGGPVNGSADAGLDESWKDRIILSAVECYEDHAEMSTPPFPFVQGWDRGPSKSTRSSKKRKRKASNGVDQSDQDDADHGSSANTNGSRKGSNGHGFSGVEDAAPLEPEVPDLPTMTGDPNIYPTATMTDLQRGTVVAFKQLLMGANWEPEVSDYRTAVVDDVVDGTLRMTLARRDRPTSTKHYDADTGERVYSKFEMPSDDEAEGDAEDDYHLELNFAELQDPRIIEAVSGEGVSLDDGST
ncbi:MAG: hypothetical protein M1838_003084, partial [Thelocarpon superellum]